MQGKWNKSPFTSAKSVLRKNVCVLENKEREWWLVLTKAQATFIYTGSKKSMMERLHFFWHVFNLVWGCLVTTYNWTWQSWLCNKIWYQYYSNRVIQVNYGPESLSSTKLPYLVLLKHTVLILNICPIYIFF